MNIKLSKIASLLSLDLIGADTNIYNLSIDSREVKKGDFFVALEGIKLMEHVQYCVMIDLMYQKLMFHI